MHKKTVKNNRNQSQRIVNKKKIKHKSLNKRTGKILNKNLMKAQLSLTMDGKLPKSLKNRGPNQSRVKYLKKRKKQSLNLMMVGIQILSLLKSQKKSQKRRL